MIKREMVDGSDYKGNQDFAFKISVSAALRDRGDEPRLVIMAELQQIVDKGSLLASAMRPWSGGINIARRRCQMLPHLLAVGARNSDD